MRKFPEQGSRFLELAKPDFSKKDDVLLNRFGRPDTLILAQGRRFYAHYEVLRPLSPVLRADLHISRLDPIWGRTVHIRAKSQDPAERRTAEGVNAWLQCVYPPQVMPPAHLMPEVNNIAEEFGMDTVIANLKLGICSHCDLESVAQFERQALESGFADAPPIAEVVFDALAEFSVDELKNMKGYKDLSSAAKVEVARRRVCHLEKLFETKEATSRDCAKKKVLRACVEAHPAIFRDCPEELWGDVRPDMDLEQDEDSRSNFESPSPDAASSRAPTQAQTPTSAWTSDRTRRARSTLGEITAAVEAERLTHFRSFRGSETNAAALLSTMVRRDQEVEQ